MVNAGRRVIVSLLGAQSSSNINVWRMPCGLKSMQALTCCCSGGLQCNAKEAGG